MYRHGGYGVLLGGYIHSLIQDFGSYLRTKVDSVEGDIELFLKKYNLNFSTQEASTAGLRD